MRPHLAARDRPDCRRSILAWIQELIAETFNTGQVILLNVTPWRPSTRFERILDERVLPFPKLTVFDPGCGVKGIRDSDNPCEAFDPGIPNGMCQTDGHYICIECRELDPKSEYANDPCGCFASLYGGDVACPDCNGTGQVSRLR